MSEPKFHAGDVVVSKHTLYDHTRLLIHGVSEYHSDSYLISALDANRCPCVVHGQSLELYRIEALENYYTLEVGRDNDGRS